MSAKLYKQFQDFHNTIKLDKETSQLKEKRETLQTDIENKLPQKLEGIGIEITKSDLHFFDQGSYRQNVSTGIVSDAPDTEILPDGAFTTAIAHGKSTFIAFALSTSCWVKWGFSDKSQYFGLAASPSLPRYLSQNFWILHALHRSVVRLCVLQYSRTSENVQSFSGLSMLASLTSHLSLIV